MTEESEPNTKADGINRQTTLRRDRLLWSVDKFQLRENLPSISMEGEEGKTSHPGGVFKLGIKELRAEGDRWQGVNSHFPRQSCVMKSRLLRGEGGASENERKLEAKSPKDTGKRQSPGKSFENKCICPGERGWAFQDGKSRAWA